MFKEEDRVVVIRTGAAGFVTYAEDGYYVVELDNGAEQEFENAALLIAEDDYIPVIPVEKYTTEQAQKVLKSVNAANSSFFSAFEGSVISKGIDYDSLSPQEQVNELAKMTAVDKREFYDASRDNKTMRKLLQIISDN